MRFISFLNFILFFFLLLIIVPYIICIWVYIMLTLQTNHYFVFCYNKHFYVSRFISVVLAPEERCEGIKTFYWWDFTATLNFYAVSMFPPIRIFCTGAKLIYNLLYVRLKKCSHNPNQRVRSPFHFFHIFTP